ncbi:hypothetical protein [Saccharothrix variisporea]|uniref:Uncharacterized protein n=1 Tax=Saccharothrix variisporea TaxID=543527 RepID=A0A495XNQ3_9PSEU|nr:hypothetical protein [Saccharothrix variisporea]RKT74093.1 hypothetical protein DFJ66_7435 [Saccharothrix variisporea]
MAERLEDELRALGREWEREPDDATVAAIAQAATRKRRRFGDVSVPAVAAALLTVVSVAGVVVPWVVAREAVPATATTLATPVTGDRWRSAYCGELGTEPLLASSAAIRDMTGWRPPGADTPWGNPLELRITEPGGEYGITIVTYRVNGRTLTLERYPAGTTFLPPERGETEQVALDGVTAVLVRAPSRTGYTVDFRRHASLHGQWDCSAPRLMWSKGGDAFALTGPLPLDEVVALAKTL